MDATDRRSLAILAWMGLILTLLDLGARGLGLRWLQAVEWPTDLYTLGLLAPEPIDVAVVGTSRAHYGLPPSGIDRCLSAALGRPTRSVGLNRLTASAYTEDIVARDLLAATPPRVLVVEVAPETLNAHHFELDYNLSSSADLVDIPECLATVRSTTRLASCAQPLFRGLENTARLFARPFSDHAHISWMALYEGGGQYCFEDEACRARNQAYDTRVQARWQRRVDSLLPGVGEERFRDYQAREGLNADHFRALLDRETARGVQILVLNMPVAELYQAEVPPAVYAEFLSAMEAELGPRGIPFLDYNQPEWSADRQLWLDPDHLDSIGAERLTRTLCEEILVPMLGG